MSDRQKGLLDAFATVTPKADIRFCVRHIWANFKLQFGGLTFKDAFWRAARATSRAEFNAQLEGIKFLSPAAHSYLVAIPSKHWSRHAFRTTCKSNMLLNNMCESFNAVLKEARDKPILTHMEWMRRYVMKRHFDKREAVKVYEGHVMPYVDKFLTWAVNECRCCILTPSNVEEFEVDCKGSTFVVDLQSKKCSCYHWELSGLPCTHVIACILHQRGNYEDYVDAAYTKVRYMLAYQHPISAMPDAMQWDRLGVLEPHPPPFRKLTGRPNLAGESSAAGPSKKLKLSRACGKCGQAGHKVKTCKNPSTANEKSNKVRPKSTSEWSNKYRKKVSKRMADKERAAAMLSMLGRGQPASVQGSQTAASQPPHSQP
ncbi:hypothetical protein vseg_013382 [Gypsophila vaccaria]